VPLNSSSVEILIAFAMIGLLGLILRYTFGRDLRQRPDDGSLPWAAPTRPEPGEDAEPPATSDDATRAAPMTTSALVPDTPADLDDTLGSGAEFGLLAVVAETATAEEAARLRIRLRDAHIRATTARGRDGRHRVLVFPDELDKARRAVQGGASF
jgi:hypothetical protein